MVLDEAQAIKNAQSQRWTVLLRLRCRNRLLLTGTPGTGKSQLGVLIIPVLLDRQRNYTIILDFGFVFCLIYPDNHPEILIRNLENPPLALSNPANLYIFDARKHTRPFDADGVRAKMLILSSPNEDHFSAFKNLNPLTLWMPLWSQSELLFLRAACFPHRTAQDVASLFSDWGGTPRYTVVNDRVAANEKMLSKLHGMNSGMTFKRALDIAGSTVVCVLLDEAQSSSCILA